VGRKAARDGAGFHRERSEWRKPGSRRPPALVRLPDPVMVECRKGKPEGCCALQALRRLLLLACSEAVTAATAPGDESPVRQQRPRFRPEHVTQRGSHACRARKVPGDPNWCPVLSNGLGRWHLSAVARRTQIAPLASDAEKQGECEWWRLARRPPLRAGRRARLNSGPLAGCRRQVLDHVDRGCSPLAR